MVTIVPMAPFTLKSTSKLRSALHFRHSIVIPCFIPRGDKSTVSFKNPKLNSHNHYTLFSMLFNIGTIKIKGL